MADKEGPPLTISDDPVVRHEKRNYNFTPIFSSTRSKSSLP